MTADRWFCLLAAASALLPAEALGQRALPWRVFKLADGLAESACISVTFTPQSKVLAKHFSLTLLTELDGYSATNLPAFESANARLYQSPAGQLWTVVPDGLQEYQEGEWVLHPVAEIAAEFHAGMARMFDPVPLFPVKQGVVLFLLPGRLMRFNSEDSQHPRCELLRIASETRLQKFSAMAPASDGGLWISGAGGLAKVPGPIRGLKADQPWVEHILPASLNIENLLEPHEDPAGMVTLIAESTNLRQKLIATFDGQNWSITKPPAEKIRHAWRGPLSTRWAATIDTLFSANTPGAPLTESEEISARQYFDLAIEPSGAFWLATSDGLFRCAYPIWRSPLTNRINAPVYSMASDNRGRLWFAGGGALHALQAGSHREFPLSERGFSLPPIQSMFALPNGNLLLYTGEETFQFDPAEAKLALPGTNLNRIIIKPVGMMKDGRVCVQLGLNRSSSADYELALFDGSNFETLNPPPPFGEIGDTLVALFAAKNGDLWLGGSSGVAVYSENKWRTFASSDRSTPEMAIAFTDLPDGRIWVATTDTIWEFDGRNWLVIRRGFDRINALLRTREGSIWVASSSSLHRLYQGTWVENGLDEGLPGTSIRDLREDQAGRLWAATSRGLSVYHPDADLDPPRTTIQGLADNQKQVREGDSITLTFQALDKWKYTPRDRLLYSYRLDEREWSSFSGESFVAFSELPAGKHYFQVRAMDRNCNVDPRPAQLEFAVVVPWFKEKRLVYVLIAGLAVALFFASLAFNRHQRLVRSYAEVEKIVAQRTSQLETANRELLHSQKMNALGTIAAGIAHDFNNILSIIKGSAQIIEDNLQDSQKVRTRVDRIKTVVEQGSGIVKAMLGFTRESDQQPGSWELNAIVEDTIRLLGDRFLREVQVSFEPASALPPIQCARDFIQQILLNFIFNAAEAGGERKQIILSTRQLSGLPASLVLTPAKANAYVAVSVQDFGSGIPPENLSRIFEPFFTTKSLSARRGTGLGLSMVYELARKMEAGLAVESKADQGSTFSLILPVTERSIGMAPPQRSK